MTGEVKTSGFGQSNQDNLDLHAPISESNTEQETSESSDPVLQKTNGSIPEGIDAPVFSSASDSYLAEVSTHVIKEFPEFDLRLQGGFFQTEEESGDIWASLRYTPFSVKNKWYEGNLDLQTGPSLHLPYSTKNGTEENYSLFAMTSLQAYFGAKQKITSWFEFREAVETPIWFALGKNISINYEAPLTIGSSLLFKINDSSTIAIGAKAVFPVNSQDVQNTGSTYPNFEHVESFTSITSQYIDIDISMQHYLKSQHISAKIGKEYEISNGNNVHFISPSIFTQYQLNGDTIYEVGGIFIGLKYAFGSSEHNLRTEASITTGFHPMDNSVDSYLRTTSDHMYNFSIRNQLIEFKQFHELNGQEATRSGNNFHTNEYNFNNCKPTNSGSWICSDSDENAQMQARIERDDGIYRVTDTRTNLSTNIVTDAFLTENTHEGFLARLKNASKYEKIQALHFLASIGYNTYDDVGKYLINGSGDVNNISNNDIYSAARTYQLGHSTRPTTVCRGFAKFITSTAKKLGFEAHSAVISTGGLPHVISLMRNPGQLDFDVINYGKEARAYHTASIVKVLDTYCREMGYGPQLNYKIYDADGKYVKTIDTNYGKQVKARMTVPSRLNPFLKGKGDNK